MSNGIIPPTAQHHPLAIRQNSTRANVARYLISDTKEALVHFVRSGLAPALRQLLRDRCTSVAGAGISGARNTLILVARTPERAQPHEVLYNGGY